MLWPQPSQSPAATITSDTEFCMKCIVYVSLLLALLAPWSAHAATYMAATCNNKSGETSVQDAITNQATQDGDIVVVPAGTNCEWSTQINMPTTHYITLTGSGSITTGVSCGTDTSNVAIPGTCGAATTGGTHILVTTSSFLVNVLEVSSSGSPTITNLTFERSAGDCTTAWPNLGLIYVGARSNATGWSTLSDKMVVLHHITVKWHQACGGDWVQVSGVPRALIYRNHIDNNVTISGGLNSTGPTIDCVARDPDLPWTNTSVYGANDTDGNRAVYVETNKFARAGGIIDMTSGCLAVIRYNDMTDAVIADHGHDSARGLRKFEIYNNMFRCGAAQWSMSSYRSRGGTGIIADNVVPSTAQCGYTVETFGAIVRVLRTPQAYIPVHTTGTITAGSKVITGMGSTTGFIGTHTAVPPTDFGDGQQVFAGTWSGPYSGQQTTNGGIPQTSGQNARVVSVDSSTQITTDTNADQSGSRTIMVGDCYPGPYPWPQQQGWGANSVSDPFDNKLEPTYIFGNKNSIGGTPGEADTLTPSDPAGFGCSFDNSAQVSSIYIQQNREWYARAPQVGDPGITSYTKFTYPHPLATVTGGGWLETLTIRVQ